jgi:hypothetical protein
MAKNLNTDSIFGSYMNNVLLKEYVKPTESTEPAAPLTTQERAYADSAKAQGKNWTDAQARLMFARENDVKSQAGAVPNIIKSGNTVNNSQGTSAHQGSASPISNQPVSNTTKPVSQVQRISQPTTTQIIPNVANISTVPTPNTSSIRPATGVAIADTEDWGEPIETTTQRIPNATRTTSIAAGDDENFHPYQKKIQKIAEKRNISKFLRHLSEKNYSTAHKYLKAVLNSKINNIVAERINKNFN